MVRENVGPEKVEPKKKRSYRKAIFGTLGLGLLAYGSLTLGKPLYDRFFDNDEAGAVVTVAHADSTYNSPQSEPTQSRADEPTQPRAEIPTPEAQPNSTTTSTPPPAPQVTVNPLEHLVTVQKGAEVDTVNYKLVKPLEMHAVINDSTLKVADVRVITGGDNLETGIEISPVEGQRRVYGDAHATADNERKLVVHSSRDYAFRLPENHNFVIEGLNGRRTTLNGDSAIVFDGEALYNAGTDIGNGVRRISGIIGHSANDAEFPAHIYVTNGSPQGENPVAQAKPGTKKPNSSNRTPNLDRGVVGDGVRVGPGLIEVDPETFQRLETLDVPDYKPGTDSSATGKPSSPTDTTIVGKGGEADSSDAWRTGTLNVGGLVNAGFGRSVTADGRYPFNNSRIGGAADIEGSYRNPNFLISGRAIVSPNQQYSTAGIDMNDDRVDLTGSIGVLGMFKFDGSYMRSQTSHATLPVHTTHENIVTSFQVGPQRKNWGVSVGPTIYTSTNQDDSAPTSLLNTQNDLRTEGWDHRWVTDPYGAAASGYFYDPESGLNINGRAHAIDGRNGIDFGATLQGKKRLGHWGPFGINSDVTLQYNRNTWSFPNSALIDNGFQMRFGLDIGLGDQDISSEIKRDNKN